MAKRSQNRPAGGGSSEAEALVDQPVESRAAVNVVNPGTQDKAVFAQNKIGQEVANSNTGFVQNGFVGMVGSLQINVTGNTNVRGKYDTLIGQAVHSSRVGSESALVGYSLDTLATMKVGGNAAVNTNSSSAQLVADEGISSGNIQAAYLVVAASQNYASTGGNPTLGKTPLSHYGFCFMGPKGNINRYFPEVIYIDTEQNRASCFFDVTEFVKDQGYGWYSAINIPSATRTSDNAAAGDYFGSWKLIVVEENTQLRPRMLRMLLGGTSVIKGSPAEVEIEGKGLSVAQNPTGEIMATMDGSDVGGSSQTFKYAVNKSGTYTSIANPAKTRSANYFFNLSVDNKDRLTDASFDPAPHLVNGSPFTTGIPGGKAVHNTDLFVMDVLPRAGNESSKAMLLSGGETSVTAQVESSNEPTILSAVGLAVDIVTPVLETDITVSNLTQHYSTADAGYDPHNDYAHEGDTLRVTMVSENVTNENRYIGLESPVFSVNIGSLKTLDRDSITAYFSSSETSNGKDPVVNKEFPLDVLRVVENADGTFTIDVSTNNTTNVITTQGFFEVTCTGEAKASTTYQEYTNRASVSGKFVDENATHHDFEMTNLGVATVKSSSDKPKYPLTITAVGPGKVSGTAKYYNGDVASISWEADSDAHVAAIFEDSSVRDDLVAQSNPVQGASLFTTRAALANSTTVTMGGKAKEVIVVFKSNDEDPEDPDAPDGGGIESNTFSVNTIADGGIENMTDSGTVAEGKDYSVSWSVKPGYRITSVLVDGVAVPFDEATNSIDFSEIGTSHTVKVLTQRVATDGKDGTWAVSTTISGPGTISPTTVVKAGSSYTVSWEKQVGSTDAELSLVKIDGRVVYDEYLNNPKTDTENAGKKDISSYTFDNIQGNHSVEVVYRGTSASNTYSKDHVVDTKISGGLGTISPSVTVPEGSTASVTVTVMPADGSEVEGIYLGRGSVKQLLENGKDGVKIEKATDGAVKVTLPGSLIDSDYTVEAVLSAPGSGPGDGSGSGTSAQEFQITTAINGGAGGKITATQVGIAKGDNRTISWQSDSDRHVTAVMVDGHMRDDLLAAGKVTFSNISADHSVVVYVSDRESSGSGEGDGGDKDPVNPDNPDGHDPVDPDPTNPNNPGTPGNPGGIPGQKGDDRYVYVSVVTVGAGEASPSVSVRKDGTAAVNWQAAKGYRVKSVTVDGIERLDLMKDLEKGGLSFENLQRSHNVVVEFERDASYVPDPADPNPPALPDPREDIDVSDPDTYSLITTKILGGAGSISANSYNVPGSNRVISWAPANGYYVQAVYVDGKEVPLAAGATSYEFLNLEGGMHHAVEVRMASLTPEPPEEPKKPEVVIDKPIDIPPMPGGKVTPDDILDIVEKEFGEDPGLPEGEPKVTITKDGEPVDVIDQSVPGTYVIELLYTDEEGNQKIVRLTYVIEAASDKDAATADDDKKGGKKLPQTGDDAQGRLMGIGTLAALAAGAAIVSRRKLNGYRRF